MNRRISPRVPLDIPCLLTLVIEQTTAYPAMLTDISQGGVQLALPPDVMDGAVSINARTVLQNVSDPVSALLEGMGGHIVWVAHRHCGLRLNAPLPVTDEEIIRMFQI